MRKDQTSSLDVVPDQVVYAEHDAFSGKAGVGQQRHLVRGKA